MKDDTADGQLEPITSYNRCAVEPVRYYFVDFGLSKRFACPPDQASVCGQLGQDKTPSELSDTIPYNPFRLDVYQLGNVWKRTGFVSCLFSNRFLSGIKIFTYFGRSLKP
jgi:hypothetical protein